jgi:hypothetical protein
MLIICSLSAPDTLSDLELGLTIKLCLEYLEATVEASKLGADPSRFLRSEIRL